MIQIIDYGAGNIRSVTNALKKLDEEYEVVSSGNELRDDCKIIFPGVGAAGFAMEALRERGFAEVIPRVSQPFLGICLGMQLLMDYSEEDDTECLGVIPGKVLKFGKSVTGRTFLKVPQIGWNKVMGDYSYFVNSYYVETAPEFVLATTLYGTEFASIIRKDNFIGMQFHPEKSGEVGLKLLNNFCKSC